MATKAEQQAEKLQGNNLFIVLTLVTLLVVGVTGFAVKFLWAEISRDKKVLDATNEAKNNIRADVDAAPQLIDAYKNLNSQDKLANALPTTSDLPALIAMLENMSNQAVISLKSVTPPSAVVTSGAAPAAGTDPATASTSTSTDASAAATPKPYDFTISFDGNFAALTQLFKNLELSARPIQMKTLQITGAANALSGDIDMETYYQDKAQLPFGTKEIQ